MADRYHDIQEMARYSKHFIAAADPYTALDPYVVTLITKHQAVIDGLEALLARKQTSVSGWKMSLKDQRALSEEARVALDALFADLESSERKGIAFDFAAFFPNQVRKDIGDSIADRQASVDRCVNALKLYPGVQDGTAHASKLGDIQTRFNAAVKKASSGSSGKSVDEKSFQQVRRRWKRSYLSCKRGMESVLIEAERESELSGLFLDLQKGSPSSDEAAKSDAGPEAGKSGESEGGSEASPA
jgi:hypothetical protein